MNAVFFDVDGTLFDTRADLAATVNHTRRDLGLAELPSEAVIAHVGQGARYLLTHAIPERFESCAASPGGPEADARFAELWTVFSGHYAEHCCETVTPYPHVRRTLDELKDRGWLLGVNTNKPAEPNRMILDYLGIRRFFGNAVVAGGDCAELKPSALPLRECASRMRGHRLSSHDWMVGDNWTDMDCGANAGVKTAFCTWGFGHLRESRCTMKINRFEELLRFCKAED